MRALGAVGEGLAELTLGGDGDTLAIGFGGDAANVCVMAARLGVPARLGGRVGADPIGRRLRAFWAEQGVDVGALRDDDDAPTGLYLNEEGEAGHRFSYWRAGSAGSRLAPADLPDAFFDDLGILVVTGVTLAISASAAAAAADAIRRARRAGARIACVLNHRPRLGADVSALVATAGRADVVIGSTEDAEAIFATADPAAIADRLGGGVAELVLTDGAAPATAIVAGTAIRQAIPAVPVVNAAGAGDAVAGAYLASRLRDEPPPAALRHAVAAASLSVQRDGCAASYPAAAEVAALAERLAGCAGPSHDP